MSSSTLSSEQILTLERIRETIIPTLLHQLSKAKTSLPDELNDREDMATQIEKLRKDLIYISHTFTGFKNFEKSVSALADILQQPQHNLELFFKTPVQTQFLDSQDKQFRSKLRLLTQIITNLKILIPSPHKLLLKVASSSALTSFQFDADQLLDQLRDLHLSKEFEGSPAVKDFRVLYNSLGDTTKLCLLCFAAFSANEVVKKGPLVHWWVGEGFVNPPVDGEKTVEEVADGLFEELTKKGCIETVKKKRRPVVRSFKMHPLIRSAVIVIAKEVKFLDFDVKGNPTVRFSKSYRACLMDGSSHLILVNKPNLDPEKHLDPDKKPLEPEKQKPLDPEKLQTIFNVNESYLDLSKVDWPKLRYVKVLHLGRWHRRVKHHIEVVDSESLTGLKYMRHLRLFSLRGVSRIMELPDSVCKLASLLILDLRACHNLEVLPKKIGWLKKLTHLDMSECYLLDRMPKGIALLSELQVLKGFIIGDHKTGSSCTLQELSGLQKLRKLTINTSREDFPRKEELIVLQQFGMLRKLIIAWGGLDKRIQHQSVAATASTVNNNGGNIKQDSAAPEPPTTCGIKTHNGKKTSKSVTFKQVIRSPTMNHEHFKELEKLDLQCYPQMTAPSWLMPGILKSLKKLYIRGGRLQNLDHVLENVKWSTVEILRLKFLSELKLDWNEVQDSFPELIYLEKFRCPKLTFFPCNESGVWLKPGN